MVTVKQVKDILEEMKTIYAYKDEKTAFDLGNDPSRWDRNVVNIITKDEETGITIDMKKNAVGDANELS
jgi:hypothetical protein